MFHPALRRKILMVMPCYSSGVSTVHNRFVCDLSFLSLGRYILNTYSGAIPLGFSCLSCLSWDMQADSRPWFIKA